GSMGMAQYDIKKVLAYSTVSQLGYMFLGIGVGAYGAAVFHLTTHAFFKACLFLGAGAVITQCGHTNDMRHYGGLWTRMPTTAKTFLIATLALAGLPPLSGFMSKDEILAKALLSNHGSAILWALGTAGAVLTSFYMFRAVYMTFFGGNRTPAPIEVKEAPKVMTNVLAVLAAGAVVVGFLGMPGGFTKLFGVEDADWFAARLKPVVMARGVVAAEAAHAAATQPAPATSPTSPAAPEAPTAQAAVVPAPAGVVREGAAHASYLGELGLFLLAIAVCAVGFLIARANFDGDGAKAAAWGGRLRFARRLLHRKWFVDELYEALLLRPFRALCAFAAEVDRIVVDGLVNLAGVGAEFAAQGFKFVQTGLVRHYALWLLGGAVAVVWIVLR
ncbi:MAG: proton-conducting transporter membrane subunit, partial [Candidatus Polarisedimenticolia bacterium]